MLKFGKKVSYRPIIVSFSYSLLTLITAIYLQVATMYWPAIGFYLASLAIFSAILFGYYLPNLPNSFTYWESNPTSIRYNNMASYKHRISMMLFPYQNQLTTINKKNIQSITVTGNLTHPKETAYPLDFSLIYAILTPLLSVLKNPITLKMTLKDGQMIELNVSRDFAYNNKKTIEKLNQFFDSLDNTQIKIINYPTHNVSFN